MWSGNYQLLQLLQLFNISLHLRFSSSPEYFLLSYCSSAHWRFFPGMYIKEPFESFPCSINQFGIWTVSDIKKSDVIVLTIITSGRRLIYPLKPMCTYQGRMRCSIFDVISVSSTSFFLIPGLCKTGSKSSARCPKVKLTYDYRKPG
jgi:hypothetical protein